MADRNVAVTLTARVDAYVAAMNRAASASGMFAASTQANLARVGGQMQHAGRMMTTALTLPIAGAGMAATKMAYDFERSMARSVGLANVPAKEVDKLSASLKSLSGETGRGPVELSRALYEAASAGLTSAQAMKTVEVASKAAAVGMGTTDDVAGLAASAISAYGSQNMDAAKAVDILTSTIREGRAAPEDLAKAMGRMLAPAAELGISFEEVGASVAYVSNVFGDTFRTVTGVMDMFIKLQAPSQQSVKILKEMGTSYEELRAVIADKGLMGALDLLREKGFAGNSQALRKLMPDTHGYNALLTLLNDNAGTLGRTLDRVNDSQGSLAFAWSTWLKTDGARIAQAWGKIQVALVDLGNIILPVAATVAGAVGDIASAISDLPAPVQAAIVAFGGLLALAGPMVMFAGSIVRNWGYIVTAMQAVQAQAVATNGALSLGGLARLLGGAAGFAGFAGAAAAVYGLEYALLPEGNKEGGATGIVPTKRGVVQGAEIVNEAVENAAPSVVDWLTFRQLGDAAESYLSDQFKPEIRPRLASRANLPGARPEDLSSVAPYMLPYPISIGDRGFRDMGDLLMGLPAQPGSNLMVTGGGAAAAGAYTSSAARRPALAVNGNEELLMPTVPGGGQQNRDTSNFEAGINRTMRLAAEQMEAFNRAKDAAKEYDRVLSSAEWGAAGFDGATVAMGAFNKMVLGGAAQTASMEGAMDGLSEALKKVGTVGADGLDDLNVKTAEGRAAFQALSEVSASWEPMLASAVDSADGNVEVLSGSITEIRSDFIAMAKDAGISEKEAGFLADAIGLIPENAQTLIELSGTEEARIKLGLMQTAIGLLEEKDQTEIALLIADGQFNEAAALAQEKLQEIDDTVAVPTVQEQGAIPSRNRVQSLDDKIAELEGKIVGVIESGASNSRQRVAELQRQIDALSGKSVYVNTYVTTIRRTADSGVFRAAGASNTTPRASAAGRYVDGFMLSTLGEEGPEVVLPLTNFARMRELLADPRVAGPMSRAFGGVPLPGGGGVGGFGGGGGVAIQLTVNAGLGTDGYHVGQQIMDVLARHVRFNGPGGLQHLTAA